MGGSTGNGVRINMLTQIKDKLGFLFCWKVCIIVIRVFYERLMIAQK